MSDPAGAPALKPSLNIAHMRLIAAIGAHGQLQHAAREMGLSQPAASRLLAEVERRIGASAFERHPKGMTATVLGRALIRRANVVAAEMEDLARDLRGLRQGLSGIARVGSVTAPAVAFLVPAIRALRAIAPDVEVRVDVGPSTVLLRALAAGDLDFVIGRTLPDTEREDLVITPGRREGIAFLVRRGHPLAGQGVVSVCELARCDWVIQERGTPIRTAVEEMVTRAGLELPRGIVSTSSLLVTMALLVKSDAVAPTGEAVTRLLISPPVGAGFGELAVAERVELSHYHLICARGRSQSPAVQRLHALVLEEMDCDAPEPEPGPGPGPGTG